MQPALGRPPVPARRNGAVQAGARQAKTRIGLSKTRSLPKVLVQVTRISVKFQAGGPESRGDARLNRLGAPFVPRWRVRPGIRLFGVERAISFWLTEGQERVRGRADATDQTGL